MFRDKELPTSTNGPSTDAGNSRLQIKQKSGESRADFGKIEQWLPVDGWPEYQVSNMGRVMRLAGRYRKSDRIYKLTGPNRDGYLVAHLRGEKGEKQCLVHRLVALAFLGPPPSPSHQVAHFDGDGANSSVSNLRWALPVENNADKKRHGTYLHGERHPATRLSDAQIQHMRDLGERKIKRADIARLIGCSKQHVSSVLDGRQRRNVTQGN